MEDDGTERHDDTVEKIVQGRDSLGDEIFIESEEKHEIDLLIDSEDNDKIEDLEENHSDATSSVLSNVREELGPVQEDSEEMSVNDPDMGYEDPDQHPGIPHRLSSNSFCNSGSESGISIPSPTMSGANRSAIRGELVQRRNGGNRVSLFSQSSDQLSTRRSAHSSGGSSNTSNYGVTTSMTTVLKSIRNCAPIFRRRTTEDTGSNYQGTSIDQSLVNAVERLGTYQSSDELAHLSASVAIAAASTQPTVKRGIQFGHGDHVLVMLTLLEMTDQDIEKQSYTMHPVNCHGYPQGSGKTEVQKQGPFLFVLCEVTQVHFDEDERYYTVRRYDTGKEQRADPGYMEPIYDEAAIGVAMLAAKHTERSNADTPQDSEHDKFMQHFLKTFSSFWIDLLQCVVPCYSKSRNEAKRFVKKLVHGDHGFALTFRFSSVNFLVLCSIAFLLIDVIRFTFLKADWDRAAATLGLVVWTILASELIFEYIIRPRYYHDLIKSDKAFAPSTARHINRFHLVCESLSLLIFLPDTACTVSAKCDSISYIGIQAPLWAILSTSFWKAVLGRFLLGLTFLRGFSLVRHWKQMWINHTFEGRNNVEKSILRQLLLADERKTSLWRRHRKQSDQDNQLCNDDNEDAKDLQFEESMEFDEDKELKSAANIGTALMIVNSHRALSLFMIIGCIAPTLLAIYRNPVSYNEASLLQANNIASNTTEDCDFLKNAVQAWFNGATAMHSSFSFVDDDSSSIQWAKLLPVRCDWQSTDGVVTSGDSEILDLTSEDARTVYFAENLNVRQSGVIEITLTEVAPADFDDGNRTAAFSVSVIYNESHAIANTYFSVFLLLVTMFVLVLVGLTVMRLDAERLVLYPLQRMLLIVVQYSKNPLWIPKSRSTDANVQKRGGVDSNTEDKLGHFETEQLINAISKIADLLRKCWGVAGAGIISTNLARTEDGRTVLFNPTVPGKQVYALFGFVGINDFSKQLWALQGDVMILINDVARVVHDEFYRWALGDSGQCNKNLGGAFLIVFRIGDFSEVHDRQKRATDVVFNSKVKNAKLRQRQSSSAIKRGDEKDRRGSSRHFDNGTEPTLQLASLPGIQAFADRALLGCLKSFAGLHRDQHLKNWQKDFRLGAGVGNFTIDAIYGFDAGWAVEGAVGSEYKIDATYLSPHVNMASRMMSACKQYGVKVLLSQAVEELLSKEARSKLRHLDTVYVKGSAVDQRIYTYDARHDGVDFFLFERSPEQADLEADSYSPQIWDSDQDLKSMRQHVTKEFQQKHHDGVQKYIDGDWVSAIQFLKEADSMMFEEVLEQGFVDYMTEDLREYGKATSKTSNEELHRLKNEHGDGACKCLIQYMQRRDGLAPPDWHGVRHLMSK